MASGKSESVIGYQSTVVTVFSLWNTLMGTTLLAVPWTIAQAGFTLGIFLTLFIAGLELYTCTLILRLAQVMRDEQLDQNNVQQMVEFSDLCRYFIGPLFGKVATVISLMTLLTAAIAYWILMSGFLFDIGQSIFEFSVTNTTEFLNATIAINGTTPVSSFETVWTPKLTPVMLVAVVYPLCLIRNPAVFQKLNSLGVLSIVYFIVFIAVKAATWGINFNACRDPSIKDWSSSFPALTGTMTLGFFLQNAVIAMTNQAPPATRIRDLGYGYLLVLVTYLYIGISIYITFPDAKASIRDNILKNFASTDVLAFIARVGLIFQMSVTFPLILYIARLQFVRVLLNRNEGLLIWRMVIPAGMITLGVLAAVFFPNIGAVLRISGSLAGLAFAFTLPCVVYLAYLRREGQATHGAVWVHVSIVLLGFINFVLQFV